MPRTTPISVTTITDAALEVIESRGYDAVTMRSVAGVLATGPASLYAHVANKADLDQLIIGRLCGGIRVPEPEAARWEEQLAEVCVALREQYLRYPGVSRAVFATSITDLDALRLNEGMLALLLDGGVAAQPAAWATDALFLYVSAYCLELSLADRRSAAHGAESSAALAALPEGEFPNMTRYAAEITSGVGHERFDFTVRSIIRGVA